MRTPIVTQRGRVSSVVLALTLLTPVVGVAAELTSGELLIRGAALRVDPAFQEVDPGRPTVVHTTLGDGGAGDVPPGLRVEAELSGPGLGDPLLLSTVPGEPFRIPGLNREGSYTLSGIRLVEGGRVVMEACPSAVEILVHRLVIASLTSRPLTREEIASYGIVIDEDNYAAYHYTVGFAVESETYEVTFDLVNGPQGLSVLSGSDPYAFPRPPSHAVDIRLPRINPGAMAPSDDSDFEPEELTSAVGGAPTIPGFLIFPSDVAFLNQFFAVIVVVQNGALEASGIELSDLSAVLELGDAGVRQAETTPPTVPGEPLPILDPGPDGEPGTADDLAIIVAGAAGEATWLVEGLEQGRHVVTAHLSGELHGLASGKVAPVEGAIPGVVLVRDPRFALTFFHPWAVRAGEQYDFQVVIANTGTTPVYDLSLRLPESSISGAVLVEPDPEQVVGELLPGEESMVTWRLEALETGRVVASGFNSSSPIDASFHFEVGVGEFGIPLSPESLVLPPEVDALPEGFRTSALELLGLAYSLANAPAGAAVDLPPVGEAVVRFRGAGLAAAARRYAYGADLDWTLMGVGVKWLGTDLWSDGFDTLRRASRRGHELESHLAGAIGNRIAAVGPDAAFAELEEAAITGHPTLIAYARGAGFEGSARLAVEGLESGGRSIGQRADVGLFERGLPGAAVLEVDGDDGWAGEVAVLAVPLEDDEVTWRELRYQVQLEGIANGEVDLEAVLLLPDGSTRRFAPAAPVPMDPYQKAWLDITQEDESTTLYVDSNGDGLGAPQEEIAAESREAPEPCTLVVRLDRSLNPISAGPARNLLLLFSQPVDVDSVEALDVGDWVVASHLELAEGGEPLISERPRRGDNARAQSDPNFLVLTTDTALSSHAEMKLSTGAEDVPFVGGRRLHLIDEPVTVDDGLRSGGVRGVVVGGDGELVPGAEVELYEWQGLGDLIEGSTWLLGLSDRVRADDAGAFVLDAVRYRQGEVDPRYASFLIRASDPASGHEARLRASLTGDGNVRDVSVFMVGRGDVVGTVTREDGTPLAAAEVHGRSVTNPEEFTVAAPDQQGGYRLSDLPVGPIQVMAVDGRDYTFGTAMILGPGQEARLDLVLPTRITPLAQVQGSVLDGDTAAAVPGVQVYLSPPGSQAASHMTVTDEEGAFRVADVPAGLTTFRVWDPARGVYIAEHQQQLLGDAGNTVEIVTVGSATGAIRGTVYRVDDGVRTPLAGAYVIARDQGRYTVTAADGGYRLDDIPIGAVGLQALDPATGEGASRTVDLTAGGQEIVVDLDLVSTSGRIQATVCDRSGAPRQAVRVVAVDSWGHRYEAITDSDGHAILEGLRPDSYSLHAAGGGALGRTDNVRVLYAGHVAEAQVVLGGRVTLEVETVAETTGGGTARVLSKVGLRYPGVTRYGTIGSLPEEGELGCPGTALDDPLLTCTVDDEGVYRVEGVPEVPEQKGRLTVYARNPFYGEASVSEALDPSDDGRRLTVNFSAPGAVSGRVLERVDDELVPVTGAVVELWIDNQARARLSTEADGVFSFDLLPSGPFSVRAYSPAGGGIGWVDGRVHSAQVLTDLDIVLRGSGGIQGNVALCYGTTKALQVGEEVHLVLKPQWAPSPFISDLEIPQLAERNLDVTLDEHGEASFTFAGLSLMAWNLRASSALHGAAMATYHLVEDGALVALDEPICLHPAGSVSGKVTFPETGVGAGSVTVQLYRAVNLLPEEWVATDATDAGGSYRFPDLPVSVGATFKYRVRAYDSASNRGGQSSMVKLCATDNADFGTSCWLDAVLDVSLSGLGEVAGTVRDAGGEGVGDAYVRLRSQVVLDQNGSIVTTGREWVTYATVDGTYSFTGIPAGKVEVSAFDPQSPLWVEEVATLNPQGEPVLRLDLELPGTAEVTVRLHDPAGEVVAEGSPRVAFTQDSLRLFREPSEKSPVVSHLLSGAEVTVAGVAAARFKTGACLGDECAALLPEEILSHRFQAALGARSDDVMGDPPANRSMDLQLVGRASVVVHVTQGGEAVEGAEVTLAGTSFYGPVNVVTQTGADGATSTLANVGVGDYTAAATVTDAYGNTLRGVSDVTVGQDDHGAVLTVDVALEEAGAADGRVLLSDRTPAAAALLTMTMHGDGRRFQAVAGADGSFELAALPSGATYELEIFQAEGGEKYLEHDVAISNEVHHFGDITLDAVNPMVAAVSPANGAQEVDENLTVSLDFSELMRHESLTETRVHLRRSGSSTPLTVIPTAEDLADPDGDGPRDPFTRVALQPPTLASDTLYVVDVLRGVEDLAGRSLGVDAHFTFRTRDSWPPSVAGVTPADDPAGIHPVGPDVEPLVMFSEAIDPSTVTEATVRLSDGAGQPMEVQRVLEDSGFTVRLRPASALSLGTFYTIEVAGVTDTSGNPLQTDVSSTFRVRDTSPPTVTLLPPTGVTVDGGSWIALEGRPITLRAMVVSDDAVATVGYSVDGGSLGQGVLEAASGEYRLAYTTPRDVPSIALTAQAMDVSGNLSPPASHVLTLTTDEPPTGTVTLSPAGSILPNHLLTVTVDAHDDIRLKWVHFNLTGALVESAATSVFGMSAHTSRSFRVPLAAPAGTEVVVACEVEDSLGQRTPLAPQTVAVLADEQQPAATVLEPEPGTDFRSGETVGFRFALSDDVTIASSTLTVNGEQVPLTLGSVAEPGEHWSAEATASWLVPEVEEAQAVPWILTLADQAGNTFELADTLSLVALVNPEAPTVTIQCPRDGDLLVAGVAISVDIHLLEDDEGDQVQSYSLLVDDVPMVADVPVNAAELSASVAWTPPADAVAGATYEIRVEARDFAGNVGSTAVGVTVAPDTVLSGDHTIDSTYDGQDLLLASGTFTATSVLSPGLLHLLQGARLTTPAGQTLQIVTDGDIKVSCRGAIDVNGRGYAGGGSYAHHLGGAPEGVEPSGSGSGGSHAGVGGQGDEDFAPGETYGSVSDPILPGGGGAGSYYIPRGGGSGGGVVLLSADELKVDGEVSARGVNGSQYGGGGAGGSIQIRADVIAGHGSIDASGSGEFLIEGGGGGQVALYVASFEGFDPAVQARADGGLRRLASGGPSRSGGHGTVYIRQRDMVFGELRVGRGACDGTPARLTVLPAVGSGEVGLIEVDAADPNALWVEPEGLDSEFSLDVTGMWVRVGGTDYEVIDQDGRRRILLAGAAGAVATGDAFVGVTKFDRIEVAGCGNLVYGDSLVLADVVVGDGSTVHGPNLGPPSLDLDLFHITAVDGRYRFQGDPGALTDPDSIAKVSLVNTETGWSMKMSWNEDGSLDPVDIGGIDPSDEWRMVAVDAHVLPATMSVQIGPFPENDGPPTVDPALISFSYGPGQYYRVNGAPGAVSDPEQPITVRVLDVASGLLFASEALADGSFHVSLYSHVPYGDPMRLEVADSHPDPLTATLDLGPMPDLKPPAIDLAQVTASIEQRSYWLEGDDDAIIDDNGVTSAYLYDPAAPTVHYDVVVDPDLGSFPKTAIPASPGTILHLAATDVGDNTSDVEVTTLPVNDGPPLLRPTQVFLSTSAGTYRVYTHDVICPIIYQKSSKGWYDNTPPLESPDGIVNARLEDRTTPGFGPWPLQTRPDPGTCKESYIFDAIVIEGAVGDEIWLVAEDDHPEWLASEALARTLPTIPGAPVVDVGLLGLSHEEDGYHLTLQTGAVADPHSPIALTAKVWRGVGPEADAVGEVAASIADGAAAVLPLPAGSAQGDLAVLEAVDSGGLKTVVRVGTLPAASLPTLSLASDVYRVREGAGAVTATVLLSTALAAPVSVDYETADGTATAGVDYQAASGTLNFAPGQTSAPITVTLLDDAVEEEDETFTVSLSNPSGVEIMAPNAAQVTIEDDDGPPRDVYLSLRPGGDPGLDGPVTVSISGGVATFLGELPAAVDRGDVVEYSGGRVILQGCSDREHCSVIGDGGVAASDVSGVDVTWVRRALTELGYLRYGVLGRLGTTDLVAANVRLNVLCYGGTDAGPVEVDGFTTSESNPLRIVAPTGEGQLGASQRHKGRWTPDAYTLDCTANTSLPCLTVAGDHVELDGLQLLVTGHPSSDARGVVVDGSEGRISIAETIIRFDPAPSSYDRIGISASTTGSLDLEVVSSIVYDIGDGSDADHVGMLVDDPGVELYALSNTIVGGAYGVRRVAGSAVAIDNLVLGQTVAGFDGELAADSTANVTSDDTGPGRPPLVGPVLFRSPAQGEGADFHLQCGELEAAASVTAPMFNAWDLWAIFDDDPTTLAIADGTNPAWVQLEFTSPVSFTATHHLVSNNSLYQWQLEVADSVADMEGQTGSYRVVVPWRETDSPERAWDSVTLPEPVTATVVRLWVYRVGGSQIVHLNEWQLDGLNPACGGGVDLSFDAAHPFLTDVDGEVRIGAWDIGGDQDRVITATIPWGWWGAWEEAGSVLVQVLLSQPSPLPVKVNYATSDGSATAGTDYLPVSGTVLFPPGETSRLIEVPLVDDGPGESDEEMFVSISDAVHARIGRDRASVIIHDGRPYLPLLSFATPTISVSEGAGTVEAEVVLEEPVAADLSVSVVAFSGSARKAFDFVSPGAGTMIPAGETSAIVSIDIIDDELAEPDETFYLELSWVDENLVNRGGAVRSTVTVTDDDVLSAERLVNPTVLKSEGLVSIPFGDGNVFAYAARAFLLSQEAPECARSRSAPRPPLSAAGRHGGGS